MRTVLILQPGFPAEIPYFTRGLKQVGARVLGVGDQPVGSLPDVAKEGLDHYLRVPSMWDAKAVIQAIRNWQLPYQLDQVECLWEPAMELAAILREAFGLPGMHSEQTALFRDKDLMKKALGKAGVRLPKHQKASGKQQVKDAIAAIGYPVIVKPLSGAGSANTYHLRSDQELLQVMPILQHVPEMVVEEYIEGREYTFDTICANGKVLYYNVAWYRPNVLVARSEEWISPQTVTLRDTSDPGLQRGIALGMQVLKALNFHTGFTHMEWFLKPNGEAVFGEIAARPPGGRSVELMNYGCDLDVFRGWAEAAVHGRLTQDVKRLYNAAVCFKRAQGTGRIAAIQGLRDIMQQFGEHIVCNNLSPIGTPRRDWKATLVSDGYIILRHPDLEKTITMIDYVAKHLQLYAR